MVVKLLCPKMRFVGWEPMGAFKRAVDERTVDELRESIGLWARRVPEVRQILPELDHMDPKYFGLVADTIELSQKKANSFLDVDMMKELEFPPFNTLDLLMAHIPIAARKAPSALDFAKEVINQAGKVTSKFFLKDSAEFELLVNPKRNANFEKGVPVVETFARLSDAVSTRGQGEFVRQEEFMEYVFAILDEGVNVDKIPLLKGVFERIRGGAPKFFDVDVFLQDSTPIEVVKANMETLEGARNWAYSFGKFLDVNAQLSKDVNDKTVHALDSIPEYLLD